MSRWTDNQYLDNEAQALPGVYCIMKDSEVLYVGNLETLIGGYGNTGSLGITKATNAY